MRRVVILALFACVSLDCGSAVSGALVMRREKGGSTEHSPRTCLRLWSERRPGAALRKWWLERLHKGRHSPSTAVPEQWSIKYLAEAWKGKSPSCEFQQPSLSDADFERSVQCWKSSAPAGRIAKYKTLYPVLPHTNTHSLVYGVTVGRKTKCTVVPADEEGKDDYFQKHSLECLVEFFPSGRETTPRDTTESVASDLASFLKHALRYYEKTSASALRTDLRVLLPMAVLQGAGRILCDDGPDSSLALNSTAVLRWKVYGKLEDIVNFLYEEGIIYKTVTRYAVLHGLLSITKQVVQLVGDFHRAGFVVGYLTPRKFVIGLDGNIYLDGVEHFREITNAKKLISNVDSLQSPPEVIYGGVSSFQRATDIWQLGFLLLELWCGGFRHADQSLWSMRASRTMVSYFQVRASLAPAIDFHDCLERMPLIVKHIVSSFLHPTRRTAPQAMTQLRAFHRLLDSLN